MEIKQISHVMNCDAKKFYDDLSEFVVKMQNNKLSVEIQYSTNVGVTGKLIYSALVIGRESNNE